MSSPPGRFFFWLILAAYVMIGLGGYWLGGLHYISSREKIVEPRQAKGGQPYQKPTGTNKEPVPTLAELGVAKKETARAQDRDHLKEQIEAITRLLSSVRRKNTSP
jgi:hypothetical protein